MDRHMSDKSTCHQSNSNEAHKTELTGPTLIGFLKFEIQSKRAKFKAKTEKTKSHALSLLRIHSEESSPRIFIHGNAGLSLCGLSSRYLSPMAS
ncbi:hypothetical protein AB3S75_018195 [Citrus x aurantiifolia]